MNKNIEEQKPTSFEKGWYHFALSSKIKQAQVYTFNYFGTSFVCFRDSNHSVNIFNAYCPHLGAHLGMGGKIKNDQLICPFHGWKYNSTGKCVEIPYCKTIPKRARLEGYLVKELHSVIYIYFDPIAAASHTEPLIKEMHPMLIEISFNNFFTTRLKNTVFQKILGIAKSTSLNFKPFGPGFFMTEVNAIGVRFLITATPINQDNFSVSLAVSIPTTMNFFHAFYVRKKAQKKLKSLLTATKIL